MKITLQQLNKISPAMVGVRGQLIVDAINEITPLYQMDDKETLQFTIPQLLHESAEFTRFEENLNYSIKGLLGTFSRKRISTIQCNAYGRIDGKRKANKEAIANTVYGGSYGFVNLGNKLADDGWALRGSGGLQATGEFVIGGFTKHYNKMAGTTHTTRQMAEMLRNNANIKLSIHSACWFISIFKKLLPKVKAGNFRSFVIGINGALKGIEEREKYYTRAKAVIV